MKSFLNRMMHFPAFLHPRRINPCTMLHPSALVRRKKEDSKSFNIKYINRPEEYCYKELTIFTVLWDL